MLDKMEKLLAKKKGASPMSDVEKDAKVGVVKAMSNMASDAMKGRLEGLKKVTVASPDKKGLEMGLDKAREMVSGEGDPEPDGGMSPQDSELAGEEHDEDEHEEMSEDEIDAELERLMKLKAEKAQK